MHARFVEGGGKAHNCCGPHRIPFKCQMFGTFNIRVAGLNIEKVPPSVVCGVKRYWFLKLTEIASSRQFFGWCIRDIGSHQIRSILEVITKSLLPSSLREGNLDVKVLSKLSPLEITEWAADKYWFQTFPFSPERKADSSQLWKAINVIDWSGLRVLDYGCHYGFFSFEASKLGASVIGVDSNTQSLGMARTIRDRIVQQDVVFERRDQLKFPEQSFDVVLYLSVHHQIDKQYCNLRATIEQLLQITRKHLFIELILPPTFPQGSSLDESEIDKIVGGKVLHRYKHAVRGYRKVYHVEIPE